MKVMHHTRVFEWKHEDDATGEAITVVLSNHLQYPLWGCNIWRRQSHTSDTSYVGLTTSDSLDEGLQCVQEGLEMFGKPALGLDKVSRRRETWTIDADGYSVMMECEWNTPGRIVRWSVSHTIPSRVGSLYRNIDLDGRAPSWDVALEVSHEAVALVTKMVEATLTSKAGRA